MIKFPCRCGHLFAVEDDMAGLQIQCPRCGLLHDVPTHQELQNMSADGTILLDLAPTTEEPGRFAELRRAFAKEKTDAEGNEIDLRQTADDFARVGGDPLAFGGDNPIKLSPKYDPVTGDLIRAFDVRRDAGDIDPAAIPMARATLSYATARARHFRPGYSLIQLSKPINLATMLFVFFSHLFVLGVIFTVALGMLYVAPLWIVLMMGLFAHYANVVEDIGPDQNDELPRFMRHFSFGDDIWRPFCRSVIAFYYCYTIPIVAFIFLHGFLPLPARLAITLILAAFGTFLFPAVYLTATTSGTMLNLRPDRIFSVIGEIGAGYAVLLLLMIVGGVIYGTGIYMTSAGTFNFIAAWFGTIPNLPGGTIAGLGLLIIGIYLIHCFTWDLGMIYRHHHDRFPWVFQAHVRVNATKAGAIQNAKTAVKRDQRELRKVGPGGR